MSYPPPPPPGPGDPYGQQPQPDPYGQPAQHGPPSGPPPGQPPYGGPGYPPPGQPGYAPPAGQPSSGKATTSLVLGIASIVVCGIFTGIPAIILGIKARREVKESNGRLGGDGLALGGLITGIIGTLLWLAVYAFLIFAVWLGAEAVNEIDNYVERCENVDFGDTNHPDYEYCY